MIILVKNFRGIFHNVELNKLPEQNQFFGICLLTSTKLLLAVFRRRRGILRLPLLIQILETSFEAGKDEFGVESKRKLKFLEPVKLCHLSY